jgi:hypothetical protein
MSLENGQIETAPGDEWEGIVRRIKKEIEGMAPDQIIEKYIEAMAQKDALGQRQFNGKKIDGGLYEEHTNRALALATLLPESSEISGKHLVERIRQRKEELLSE